MALKARPKMNEALHDAAKPVSKTQELQPDFSLLTEAEKEQIRARAFKEVEEKERQRALKAFLEAEMERLERERHPEIEEAKEDVYIDVALYADRVVLDGVIYWADQSYTLPRSKVQVIREIIQRTKRHEHEIRSGDPYQSFYQKNRASKRVNMQTGQAYDGNRPLALKF